MNTENEKKLGNDAIRPLAPKLADFIEKLVELNAAGAEAVAEFAGVSERLGGEVGIGLAAAGTGLQAAVAITSNLYSQTTRLAALWVLEANAMAKEAERVTKPDIVIFPGGRQNG